MNAVRFENIQSLTIGFFPALEKEKTIRAFFSTRKGGFSSGPYESLNLGLKTKDDPEKIKANRSIFFRTIGVDEARVVRQSQVHSANIAHVIRPGFHDCTDASFTDKPDVYLTVTASDCAPVIFFEPRRKIAGVIHAGWKGTMQRIVYQTIQRMTETFGAQPDDVIACIGPSVCPDCYEVGEDVAAQFPETVLMRNGFVKPHLDLWKATELQLREAGVLNVVQSGLCTVERQDLFFSHRGGGGVSGRMLGVIGLCPT